MKDRVFQLCDVVRETGYAVHQFLGPGHLERVYENAMANRLRKLGLDVKPQHPLAVYDEDGTVLGEYFTDLLVENCLIVELKAVRATTDEHTAQLLDYLRASRIEHGLLVNFGESHFSIRKFAMSETPSRVPRPHHGPPSTLLSVLLIAASCVFCGHSSAAPPNVVVIVGDDMGYADLGVHGCKDIPTPHLDSIAQAGVRFTAGYVTGPYCSPTRAGLLTGRYQTRFGHEFNPGGAAGLPLAETTIAQRMSAAGYVTGLVGKWHLGSGSDFHPQKRGFGEFFGFLGGAHSYFDDRGIFRGTQAVEEKAYLTDAFGREAVAFVDQHKSKPFFLYLAFNAVHTPMQADDARLTKFAGIADKQRRTYAAMMFAMDEAVGHLLAKLRAEKLEENTLVVFHSDNGGPTMQGVTVNGSVNAPLRGSKRTTLEGGVRVPFFVKWPAQLKPAVYPHPVLQLDIIPTILVAAEIPTKPTDKLDGVDLLPYLTGKNTGKPHASLYWRFGPQMAIRDGDWKLVRYDLAADGKKGGVSAAKLYNLASDIGEATDLAAREPERVKALQAKWETWNRGNVPPLWGGGKKTK